MKKISKLLAILLSLTIIFGLTTPIYAKGEIRNVIVMIPDGGGLVPFSLASSVKELGGFNKELYPNATKITSNKTYLSDYLVGLEKTYSASSEVTDSAAGGTALATGYKTNNGSIGIDAENKPRASVLEACQYVGKSTGIVSTYEWTNATPAAFTSHNASRSNYTGISEQIVNQNLDVCLGCGFGLAKWGDIGEAEKRGYKIINNKDELSSVKAGDKIWGNLVSNSYPYDLASTENLPSLADMTKGAITALSNNKKGFFLMVEGSKIDGGGHANDPLNMVGDYVAFDEAFKVALDFAEKRDDTIIVVAADHDTGGMALPENIEEIAKKLQNGEVDEGITWESTGHTARNCGVFVYAPKGTKLPGGISKNKGYEENVIENTDLPKYSAELLDVDLDKTTSELFVDVTDEGVLEDGYFKFNDKDAIIGENQSYAFFGDKCVDLEGQIAVCINERFYIPKLLTDIINGKVKPKEYKNATEFTTFVKADITADNIFTGEIKVKNLLPTESKNVKIEFISPKDTFEPIEATLEPNETNCFYIESKDIHDTVNLSYIATDDKGVSISKSVTAEVIFADYSENEIVVDGKLDEKAWQSTSVMHCNDVSRIKQITNWKGERDLSGDFSILWDKDNVYFSAVVYDENFNTVTPANEMWKGDCIQVGFYLDSEGKYIEKNAGSNFEELGIGYIDNEPTVYRFKTTGEETEVGIFDKAELALSKGEGTVTYEMKCKWTDLFGKEYTAKTGDYLVFSMLINDNDGEGRRGWIEYFSGIGTNKNVNEFGKLYFRNNNQIKVKINGELQNFDVEPLNVNDSVMIPIRGVAEALGAKVNWNEKERKVEISNENNSIEITIDKENALKNNEEIKLLSPAFISNGRTYLPIRFVAEALDAYVDWDNETKTVIISNY